MNFRTFDNFNYFGVYISAYTNEKGEIKKSVSSPSEVKYKTENHFFKDVWNKDIGQMIKPNGISINCRELSTIDVDKPSECDILDDLKNDCKFYIKTKNGFHFYFNKENDLPRNQQKGIADINLNQLFYIPTYTHDETKEEYHYEIVKSEKLVDMPKYAIMWCKMLLNLSKTDIIQPTTKKSNVEKIVKQPDIQIEKFDLKVMNEILNIFFEGELFTSPKDWRSTAYMSRHLNNSEECFKLFDKYSRKVEKYKSKPEIENRKEFFGDGKYNLNYDENGTLIKCSKLNPAKYKKTLQHLYRSKYEPIKINSEFIYPNDNSNDYIFDDWYKNYKSLCIKSSYGTGKTYGFKKIIEKFNPKKILFITYRQSLAYSFSKDLKEKYGFDIYFDDKKEIIKEIIPEEIIKSSYTRSENGITTEHETETIIPEQIIKETFNIRNSDRLIIQLDSLHKLNSSINMITQKDCINKYDMIVLDEIEGLLNHLSFDKIDQYVIHDILKRLIKKSPKILLLDGDMNDRTFDFVDSIKGGSKIYHNEFKPNKKHFIFTKDLKYYENEIDKDIKNGKKIVIVSMTKTDTEKYYNKYKDTHKVIIHNSIEKNKKILLDVNEEWSKCDILIYSPSVESGVDFNIRNYFYKCYAILSNTSTSYRAFNQMLNRVRFYENNDIICFMPLSMNRNQNDILYRYDELKLTKYNGIEMNSLVNTLIHNDTEKINSNNYFMTGLINMIEDKGHTFIFRVDEITKKSKKEGEISQSEIMKKEIVDAKNVSEYEYTNLLIKGRKNEEMSREENMSITKMYYKKVFKLNDINDVNDDFIKEHYSKCHIVKNFKMMNIKLEERRDKIPTEYLKNFKFDKIDTLKSLLNKVGYVVEKNEIIKHNDVDFDITKDSINKVISSKDFRILFNCKREVKQINTLDIFNETLFNYGLVMNKKKHKKRTDGKEVINYTTELKHINIMDSFLEREIEQKNNDFVEGIVDEL